MSAQMMNENVKASVSTTFFTFDHINRKIIGTELNFKKSGIPGSEQDKELMCRIEEHPNYDFKVLMPTKEKRSYKGLKRELMYDYIDCFGSEEMLEKFQQMKEDGTGFPAMKSWFLDQFPKFNVEKAKGDIKRYRLGHVKAKYKVAKTAPKNRKSTSNIADSPNQ